MHDATAPIATPSTATAPVAAADTCDARTLVSVEQYIAFRRDGFVVVPGIVSQQEVA